MYLQQAKHAVDMRSMHGAGAQEGYPAADEARGWLRRVHEGMRRAAGSQSRMQQGEAVGSQAALVPTNAHSFFRNKLASKLHQPDGMLPCTAVPCSDLQADGWMGTQQAQHT